MQLSWQYSAAGSLEKHRAFLEITFSLKCFIQLSKMILLRLKDYKHLPLFKICLHLSLWLWFSIDNWNYCILIFLVYIYFKPLFHNNLAGRTLSYFWWMSMGSISLSLRKTLELVFSASLLESLSCCLIEYRVCSMHCISVECSLYHIFHWRHLDWAQRNAIIWFSKTRVVFPTAIKNM